MPRVMYTTSHLSLSLSLSVHTAGCSIIPSAPESALSRLPEISALSRISLCLELSKQQKKREKRWYFEIWSKWKKWNIIIVPILSISPYLSLSLSLRWVNGVAFTRATARTAIVSVRVKANAGEGSQEGGQMPNTPIFSYFFSLFVTCLNI